MRRSRGLFPALILVGVAVAGCGPQAGQPTATTPAATSAAPTPSASTPPPPAPPSAVQTASETATAEPTATAAPTATATRTAWKTFTTADGQLAFDYPSGWSVRDPAGELPEGGGAFAEVTNEAGRPLATLRTNMATGSTCMEKYPFSEF